MRSCTCLPAHALQPLACDACRWPAQVDHEACNRVLWGSYEAARGIGMHELRMLQSERVPPMDVLRRLV